MSVTRAASSASANPHGVPGTATCPSSPLEAGSSLHTVPPACDDPHPATARRTLTKAKFRAADNTAVFLPFQAMKRIAVIALALGALAALPVAAAAQQLTSAQLTYRDMADSGVKTAQKLWFDRRLHWYRDRLNDHDRYPLATIWSI